MMPYFQLLCAAGFLASAYALYVRYKVLKSPGYSPACDINDRISCSKAFGSTYSKTMGIPNPLGGLFYYAGLLVFSFSRTFTAYLFYLTLPALGFSLYLAYISYFRQKNFCLVCSFIYLANLALTALAFNLSA
jgi:vitamin-K-epoxide reductase (warfarin-sensitive)